MKLPSHWSTEIKHERDDWAGRALCIDAPSRPRAPALVVDTCLGHGPGHCGLWRTVAYARPNRSRALGRAVDARLRRGAKPTPVSRARFELIGETFPGVMLWRIDLDVPVQATELACLSTEERARAARFRAARDRDRYLRAHAATRQLLARHSGDAACELAFVTGEFGKPQLAGALRLHFNLSHSDNAAVLAISDTGAVGVDVEILREIPDASVLAERHFTLVERGELASAPAGQVDRVFLRGWTRKEACLKAVGVGLRLAPSSFDVGLSSAPRQVVLRQPACALRLASFEDCRGVIGALAQVG